MYSKGGVIHRKRGVSQVITQRKRLMLVLAFPLLWLLVLVSVLSPFSTGIASAQMINPPATSEAQTDSLTAAFFLLKYDYDLTTAKAEADSITYEIRLSTLEDTYKRQMWTIAGTVLSMLLLYFVTNRLD